MTEGTDSAAAKSPESTEQTPRPVRRRASRAAGPAAGIGDGPTAVAAPSAPAATKVRTARVAAPPRRRRANRGPVLAISLAATVVLVAALAAGVVAMMLWQRTADAAQERDQRFVDTAKQTVVNMFSYTQNNIDESVNRFVDGTSGPLRDMLSQSGNVDNLKALFQQTNASSEAVINGAALESLDNIAGNAAVLVSVRVTVTDLDGTNAPSQPYRLRVVVHEDDNGHMTGYDLKYPDGGN
jgi:Mce-associated membrane protein